MQDINAYMRVYHLKRYYKRKNEIISLLGGKCNKCGSVERLEIDHKNPDDKIFSVTLLLSFSKQRVNEEIKKCQLLCKKCHIEKNILEAGNKPSKDNHGSLSCYQHQRCRCRLCKDAQRDWTRKYRLTHKRKT